ncbi:hypothetical protein Tco_1187463, partial [Tanacetum coccineum]
MFKDSNFDVLDDAMKDVDATPVTPPTRTTVFDDDEDLTIAQTLVNMRSEKAKEKGVAFKDETESVEKTKNKVQGDAQIELDAKVALRHQAELDEKLRARMDVDYELAARMTQEQEKYTIEERARLLAKFFERKKKQLAAERAEAIRNKPPTKTQLRNLMMTYLKNMGGYKHKKEAQKSGKRLKRVAGSYATQKSAKKPKVMKSAKGVTEEEATEYKKEKEE